MPTEASLSPSVPFVKLEMAPRIRHGDQSPNEKTNFPRGDPSTPGYYKALTLVQAAKLCKAEFPELKGVTLAQAASEFAKVYARSHPYSDWGATTLKVFAQQRNITWNRIRPRASKEYMVELLQKTDHHSSFPLLALPVELREKVYRYAFRQKAPIQRYRTREGTYHKHGEGSYAEHNLTRTSRAVRAEALPVFYAERRFSINTWGLEYKHCPMEHLNTPEWVYAVHADKLSSLRLLSMNGRTGGASGLLQIDLSPNDRECRLALYTLDNIWREHRKGSRVATWDTMEPVQRVRLDYLRGLIKTGSLKNLTHGGLPGALIDGDLLGQTLFQELVPRPQSSGK